MERPDDGGQLVSQSQGNASSLQLGQRVLECLQDSERLFEIEYEAGRDGIIVRVSRAHPRSVDARCDILDPGPGVEVRAMGSAGPLVVEAAINGSTTKAANPNVPRSVDEIVATALACVDAGASIVHNHNDEPNFGEPSTHSPDPYVRAWRRIWDAHPGLLMHPTTSGERSASIEDRFAHIEELRRRGALTMSTADAGCFSIAFDSPDGPLAISPFGNSAADVSWIFGWCREADIPVHVSIFEPGFLRLVLAHQRAGSLPRRTKVQLYFGGPVALFGLPPTQSSLDAYAEMLADSGLPWMVGVLWGDVLGSGLAEAALRAGGHVRVGLEDYAGPEQPTNEVLVARAIELGDTVGRRAVGVAEVEAALWG